MFRGDVQRTGVEMLADLSPAPAAKYANQAANIGAVPSGGSGAVAREPGGMGSPFVASANISRISFANILSRQRSSPRRHAVFHKVQMGGLRRGKRPYALACNVTTRLRRSDRPPSPLIEALTGRSRKRRFKIG